jgi:hypothetical protein
MRLEGGEGNKRKINAVSKRSKVHVNFQTSKIISNSTSAAIEVVSSSHEKRKHKKLRRKE